MGDGSMGVLEVARAMLEGYPICDHCLGRQFALLGHGLSNEERGEAIKLLLTAEGHRLAIEGDKSGRELLKTVAVNGLSEVASKTMQSMGLEVGETAPPCHLCGGKFESLGEMAQRLAKRLMEYEYQTFLIGVRIPAEVEEREDELRARYNVRWGESIRGGFSRELGKRVTELTGKAADFKRPDILAIMDPFTSRISLQVNPIFIAGRYRKLIRGIPQAKWLCWECEGRGCPRCGGTGKMYQESVEELVTTPAVERAEGVSAKFHAAGREDVDARVLGSGRPFVIEVKRPRRRWIDLEELMGAINDYARGKVEVSDLGFSSKEGVREMKARGQAEKVYRAVVEFEGEPSSEDLLALEEALNNRTVQQKTPVRVLHRRSDRVREKQIYKISIRRLKPNLVEMLIRSQGGLYVKELITGDDGRTRPSVAEVTHIPAKCVELDVMEVGIGDG